MNLKKINLDNFNLNIKKKFLNRSVNKLQRGDYIKIFFFIYDTKKKGGANSRINKLTALLLKKKVRYNHVSILVSTIYKNEKVKWWFIMNSPQIICIKFIKKSLNQKNLIKI